MKTRDSTGGTVIESYRRRRIVPSCPAQRLTDDDDDKIISHSGSDEMPYLKLRPFAKSFCIELQIGCRQAVVYHPRTYHVVCLHHRRKTASTSRLTCEGCWFCSRCVTIMGFL